MNGSVNAFIAGHKHFFEESTILKGLLQREIQISNLNIQNVSLTACRGADALKGLVVLLPCRVTGIEGCIVGDHSSASGAAASLCL